ncbi:NUDIX hydrolase [Rhizobiales bacterium]|uniref:NUDIX hydrolase n=1 Tax=Hongsoonwoonella zoysiae TaxID=2821844 RepID=UPI0015611CB8|nr:NUDIX hydrolase [Hongsoonwoonella zoysiae]NRG19523.1 NUDIX hydrolase [Hongsoonwoonella zoysiae]
MRLVERLRLFLGGKPPAIQTAALPWRRRPDGTVEVLLATSRDTGRWVLPKGWPHKGKTLGESASQEAYEEVGVHGRVADREVGHYNYLKWLDTGLNRRVRVSVFPLEVRQECDVWPEQGQREIHWTTCEEAAERVDEPELAAILRKFPDKMT